MDKTQSWLVQAQIGYNITAESRFRIQGKEGNGKYSGNKKIQQIFQKAFWAGVFQHGGYFI